MTNNELTQAYKIRHALDEKTADIPNHISQRLATGREIALSRKKTESQTVRITQLATTSNSSTNTSSDHFIWLKRMSCVVPFVIVAFGLIGIYQYERHQQIAEAAYIDAEVLSDELPVSAYLDNGFNVYLNKKSDAQ
tara:strand:- start:11920 stop:12330 length:411 start_codon:yes stop_codon:yes gene_type:complete